MITCANRISIVFSFFKKTLDCIANLLSNHDARFCRVDGSLSMTQRRQVLDDFEEGNVKVLLITLGTGAVG